MAQVFVYTCCVPVHSVIRLLTLRTTLFGHKWSVHLKADKEAKERDYSDCITVEQIEQKSIL